MIFRNLIVCKCVLSTSSGLHLLRLQGLITDSCLQMIMWPNQSTTNVKSKHKPKKGRDQLRANAYYLKQSTTIIKSKPVLSIRFCQFLLRFQTLLSAIELMMDWALRKLIRTSFIQQSNDDSLVSSSSWKRVRMGESIRASSFLSFSSAFPYWSNKKSGF